MQAWRAASHIPRAILDPDADSSLRINVASGVVESKNISDVLYFSGKIERNKSPEAALSVARHAWNPALSRWDGKGACHFTLFKTQKCMSGGKAHRLSCCQDNGNMDYACMSPHMVLSEGQSPHLVFRR